MESTFDRRAIKNYLLTYLLCREFDVTASVTVHWLSHCGDSQHI